MKKFNLIFLLFSQYLLSQTIIISDVPAYIWHDGCVPTSIAMVLGYYDSHGYPELFPGESRYQNYIIDSVIASPKHFNDYALPMDFKPNVIPDKSTLGGAHPSDCIADYLKTSWSSENLAYGHTRTTNIPQGFKNYVECIYPNCIAECSEIYFYNYIWDLYKREINNNHPVLLLVDSDGDGESNHMVTGIGYIDSLNEYIFYDTYTDNMKTNKWVGIGRGNVYGVEYLYIMRISAGNDSTRTALLDNNYPNPFNPITNISFKVDIPSFTVLVIYNSTGREVGRPVSKFSNSGSYSTVWNGSNFASGVYFYQIRTNGHIETKKMILLK
jgi:hypothetical protein